MDFSDKFNTKLNPSEQRNFQTWLAGQSQTQMRDLSGDLSDYDLAGYWKSNKDKTQDIGGHLTDEFKKPNHPTFSNESHYHNAIDSEGGRFHGGSWEGSDKEGWSFIPSQTMLEKTHSIEALQDYMKDVEPDVELVLPTPYKSLGTKSVKSSDTEDIPLIEAKMFREEE